MRRILALGTHPDDIEIGCGGTIAALADEGCDIRFVVVTSGEEGSLGDKAKLRTIREEESRKSAETLGAKEIHFFGEPDGLRSFSLEAKLKLIQIIRTFRPEVVFVHSTYDAFPDHRVTSDLTRSALLAASGPWYPEGGPIPHSVETVLGYEVWNPIQAPQLTVDISSSMDRKLKALECHASQTENVNYLGAIRGLAEYRGAMSMTGKYAESFEVMKLTSTSLFSK